jgi:hypothetical protein
MESFLQNSHAVFWTAVAVMSAVPVVTAAAAGAWYKLRSAELEASMKMRMLEMGMSAQDIERVIQAKSASGESCGK